MPFGIAIISHVHKSEDVDMPHSDFRAWGCTERRNVSQNQFVNKKILCCICLCPFVSQLSLAYIIKPAVNSLVASGMFLG